jgi:hypothetical protein
LQLTAVNMPGSEQVFMNVGEEDYCNERLKVTVKQDLNMIESDILVYLLLCRSLCRSLITTELSVIKAYCKCAIFNLNLVK